MGASRFGGGISTLASALGQGSETLVQAASIVATMGNVSRLHPMMLEDVKGDPEAICLIVNKEI